MNIYIHISHSLPSIDHPELPSCSNVSSFIGIYISSSLLRVESLKVRLYKYIFMIAEHITWRVCQNFSREKLYRKFKFIYIHIFREYDVFCFGERERRERTEHVERGKNNFRLGFWKIDDFWNRKVRRWWLKVLRCSIFPDRGNVRKFNERTKYFIIYYQKFRETNGNNNVSLFEYERVLDLFLFSKKGIDHCEVMTIFTIFAPSIHRESSRLIGEGEKRVDGFAIYAGHAEKWC